MVNTVGKDISEVLISYTSSFLDTHGTIKASIETNQEKRALIALRILGLLKSNRKRFVKNC